MTQASGVWKSVTGGMTKWMEAAPPWLQRTLEDATKWAGIEWSRDSQDPPKPMGQDGRREVSDLRGAEAVGSCVQAAIPEHDDKWGYHHPAEEALHVVMLDIDHNAILIPSSTPGHHHLIVGIHMPWTDYRDLLETAAEVGLIQRGYADASLARGESFLRLPWIRKNMEKQDAQFALAEWLDADDRPAELQTPEALAEWLAQDD